MRARSGEGSDQVRSGDVHPSSCRCSAPTQGECSSCSVCRSALPAGSSTNKRRLLDVRRSAPSRSCPPCRCRSRSRVGSSRDGVSIRSPGFWCSDRRSCGSTGACLPACFRCFWWRTSGLRPPWSRAFARTCGAHPDPPPAVHRSTWADHRCQLRSPGEDVAHQQPCVRPFPSSNGWICMKRWFSPPADLRSVSNSSARLPSVGSPHSQRGDCAPVTVAAFNPLLPFSCSVVPGPFRAASACRARSSSLTTPCAGVSPPTTEFRRESGVDGSLIRRPAHLVRPTAGHGPTRACRRCDKTRAHRRHCQPAFGARHGSNP